MNLQDISDFIDLVKNPAKYETYLKELVNAKDQLTAASELVGKASEIDKLQKKATKLVEQAEASAKKLTEDAEASIKQRQDAYDKMFDDLNKQTADVTSLKQEAASKFVYAQKIEKDVAARERVLRENQKAYDIAAADLAKKTAEVEDKLAKLRSLMGE